MSTNEMVSAICPTYGRSPVGHTLLEECVYWFTRQTHANRELVILNDAKDQTLICRVPGVRVVNTRNRFPSLGEKFNELLALARGNIVMPWEDDDISLPHRMAQAVEKLRGDFDYFNPQKSWYQQDGQLHHKHTHGVCHNASAYRKEFAVRIGGYDGVSGSQDLEIDTRMKMFARMPQGQLDNLPDWSYVYRWGVSQLHLSGHRDMEAAYKGATRLVIPGVVEIVPKMHRDYHHECADIVSGIGA